MTHQLDAVQIDMLKAFDAANDVDACKVIFDARTKHNATKTAALLAYTHLGIAGLVKHHVNGTTTTIKGHALVAKL